jgi:integrase-like protein
VTGVIVASVSVAQRAAFVMHVERCDARRRFLIRALLLRQAQCAHALTLVPFTFCGPCGIERHLPFRFDMPRGGANDRREPFWSIVREIGARAQAGLTQQEIASEFSISQPLCSQIVRGDIWDPDAKLAVADEMRAWIVGALDTGCRRGEMMKIQNKHVDWRHRWIRILKEDSKTEVARVIPFEAESRLHKLLKRRKCLGPEAFVFGEATTGAYVKTFRSAWETLLLLANGIEPRREKRGQRLSNRKELAQINLHWHDLRHEALSRLADDGVPVHELQMLAGHASITTTQRYMNARANSLAESMRLARERRANRVPQSDDEQSQVG